MPSPPPSPDPAPARSWRPGPDLGVAALFVIMAAVLTGTLWPDPGARTLALNPTDQTLFEWFLAVDTHLATDQLGLITDRLNVPHGVNMMANTSVIVPGILLGPVTALFGSPTTFAVLVAGNLAGTAIAWYLLYRRLLGAGRPAAAVGAGLCGFAPAMLSQSNGHPHMTAQWLVPLLVWLVVRLARAAVDGDLRRCVGTGAALGAATVVQVFIGEEVLFLTAVSLLLVTVGYAVQRPRFAARALPRFLAGAAVAAALAGAVLAYPLWMQFAGPLGVPNGPFPPQYFSADLAGFVTSSPLSLPASVGWLSSTGYGAGSTELNTHLGWPLVVVAGAATWWLRRQPVALACAGAALVMAALSLGPEVRVAGESTGVTGPYRLLEFLPVVDGALPTRFALAVVPLLATVLVFALLRAAGSAHRPVRLLVPAAVGLALLPALPAPLPGADRPPLPRFIADGHWRDCVPAGGVLVPVPPADPVEPWPMRWAAATRVAFGIPQGFFIGPHGEGGRASMGVGERPTSSLLAEVSKTGRTPAVVTAEQRTQAARDVAFWGASCVVLPADAKHAPQLRATAEALWGPATAVADAWTWQVGGPAS